MPFCCRCCGHPEADDADLAACVRARSGCFDWAAQVLVERYSPMIAAAVRRLGRTERDGCLAYDDGQDAAQGARLGLMQAAQSFDPNHGPTFAAYAKQYVDGAARRHLRSARGQTTRGTSSPTDLVPDFPEDAAGSAPSAEDEALGRGWGQGAIATAFGDLPVGHRALLRAVYGEAYTLTEVATERGVTKQAVSAMHKRILARLGEGYLGDRGSSAA